MRTTYILEKHEVEPVTKTLHVLYEWLWVRGLS